MWYPPIWSVPLIVTFEIKKTRTGWTVTVRVRFIA
jgi:hypothetical protein